MAISLSNPRLPPIENHIFGSENSNSLPLSFSLPKSEFPNTKTLHSLKSKRPIITRVLSQTSESLSSIITELDKERELISEGQEQEDEDDGYAFKQPERRLADVWREVHGQDDWVGLLDPMDPILRSELIRYGEMAQ